MRTYKLYRDNGHFFAFEIENAYIRPPKIAKLLEGVGEVTDIHEGKKFNLPEDVHVKFRYQGKDFIVWEPYGDSSRYWVGSESEEDIDIHPLEMAFDKYQPPTIIKIFGDLITLNFKSFFGK
jgi:hypothetical protein